MSRVYSTIPSVDDAEAQRIAASVRSGLGGGFDLALIAGSGIHSALHGYPCKAELSYAEIEGLPQSKILGHHSSLQWLVIASKNVLVFRGRFHGYEGHSLSTSVLPARISAALQIPALLCTNAAGGMNPSYQPADLMLCEDLLNMTQLSVCGTRHHREPVIDQAWTERVYEHLRSEVWLHKGVYCCVSGPSYETKAEIAMFSRFADVIGMSTLHEAHAARLLGLRVLAASVITNALHGESTSVLHHAEVLDTAQRASERIAQLVEVCCSTLSDLHAC